MVLQFTITRKNSIRIFEVLIVVETTTNLKLKKTI